MHAVIIFEDNEYRAKVIEGQELGPFDELGKAIEAIRRELIACDDLTCRAIILGTEGNKWSGKIGDYEYQLNKKQDLYLITLYQKWSDVLAAELHDSFEQAASAACAATGAMVIRRAAGIELAIVNLYGKDKHEVTRHHHDDELCAYIDGSVSSDLAAFGLKHVTYSTVTALKDDELEALALRDWCAINGIEHKMPAKHTEFLGRHPFEGESK